MEEGENVKELLEEAKNLSGLMLDLAYSSVFFKSKEIAQEVVLLFDDFEEVEERLYLHLFAASRGRAERLISVIDIVEAAKDVALAAKHMSQLVTEGKELHPIIQQALAESDESIAKAAISAKSKLAGRTIGELRPRSEIGFDIVAIKRGAKWIWDPKKKTELQKGDIVIGLGSARSCEKFRKLAKG